MKSEYISESGETYGQDGEGKGNEQLVSVDPPTSHRYCTHNCLSFLGSTGREGCRKGKQEDKRRREEEWRIESGKCGKERQGRPGEGGRRQDGVWEVKRIV